MRWFDDPAFISQQIKTDILYHTFALAADKIIIREGEQSTWQNRTHKNQTDICFNMPGQLIQNQHARCAIFSCCLDPQGCCYHRGITFKPARLWLEEYATKGNWDIPEIFDELKLSHDDHAAPDEWKKFKIKGEIRVNNPLYVAIHDYLNETDIILYKLGKAS